MIALHLGERTARFAAADGRPLSGELSLGATSLCERWLRHDPPTPVELEAAIEAVEDLVMPLHGTWPADASLQVVVDDAALAPLPALVGDAFTRDALEAVFDRAAAIVLGRPRGSDPQLADARVIAGLLVVREAMHHLGFGQGTFGRE